MAANLKAKLAYVGNAWSDVKFFHVPELIELVFKIIVCQGHNQKFILNVKFIENGSTEGFPLSDIRLKWVYYKLSTFKKC